MRLVMRICAASLLLIIVGCAQRRPDFFANSNTLAPPANSAANQQLAQQNPTQQNPVNPGTDAALAQVEKLNSQFSQFDADNRDLHTQIAQLQQQLNLSNEEKRLLRQQMGDTASQLRSLQKAKADLDQRLNFMQTSTRARAGATIRANNSLASRINAIKLTGVEVRQDGDVVRIDLPSDRLFVQGTYQLQRTGAALLDQIAAEIQRNYPRQLLGIEGHTDNVPIAGAVVTHHQIAAQQSMAVFDYLSRSGRLPPRQMFTMAVGSNQPRFSNGDAAGRSKNRRIEIVVYPEVFQGG